MGLFLKLAVIGLLVFLISVIYFNPEEREYTDRYKIIWNQLRLDGISYRERYMSFLSGQNLSYIAGYQHSNGSIFTEATNEEFYFLPLTFWIDFPDGSNITIMMDFSPNHLPPGRIARTIGHSHREFNGFENFGKLLEWTIKFVRGSRASFRFFRALYVIAISLQ